MCGCVISPGDGMIELEGLEFIKEGIFAEGSYGRVWKVRQSSSNSVYAAKQIFLQSIEQKAMFDKERRIMEALRGQSHSLQLRAAGVYHERTEKSGYLVTDLGITTLLEFIRIKQPTRSEATKILVEVLHSLKQLHNAGFIHLDVKPENIILVAESYRICDFGSAMSINTQFDPSDKKGLRLLEEYIEANSTLTYRSPEMVDIGRAPIGPKSDVWMVGILGFMMLERRHPFENQGKLAIITGRLQLSAQGQTAKTIAAMLEPVASKRLTIDQALSWLSQ